MSVGYKSAQVALLLRREIEEGVFPPHSRLPSEKELCRRFKVTRPTIRRGIAELAGQGLLRVRRGVGAFVNRLPGADRSYSARSRTISVMYPFDAKSLSQVQAMVNSAGYLLCAYSQMDWYWDSAKERRFLEAVKEERRLGLVAFCSPREPTNGDLLEEMAALGIRVVHIEPYSEHLPGQNYILADYRYAGYAAVCRFLMAGYQDIRLVSMGGAPYERLLKAGALDALADMAPGLSVGDDFVLPVVVHDHPEGWSSMRAFLQRVARPTALLCCSTSAGEIVLTLARELNLSVPDMLGIAGVWHDDQARHAVADHFVVRHLDMARQAIEAITTEPWRGIRKLIKPEWISIGTVRKKEG